jgi:hypothetical protein
MNGDTPILPSFAQGEAALKPVSPLIPGPHSAHYSNRSYSFVPEYKKVGFRTGLWLGELTDLWDVAEKAGYTGYTMDIVSPSGGPILLDPESLAHGVLAELGTEKRYMDRAYMDRLEHTRRYRMSGSKTTMPST